MGNNIYRKDGKIKNGEWQIEKGWIRVNPAESHPEQRGHGSSRESRGERCEDRKGFPRWGKSLSFEGTYLCPSRISFPFAQSRDTSEFHNL